MPKRDYDIRIRLAYIRLKRAMALYFTLWLLALVAGASFLIIMIFLQYSIILKAWGLIVVVLLFIKLAYDAGQNMKHKYDAFKTENNVSDAILKNF